MASDGEKQPPPLVQTLATTGLGHVEFNMDNLSKPELLTLLSIMEGELEARDLVIEALRARRKEVFLQERYGHFSLTDPFLALQRDVEAGGGPGGEGGRRGGGRSPAGPPAPPPGSSPAAVLEVVMAHCRKMQERMSAQLTAAEGRQERLEMEKLALQSVEADQRRLSSQLAEEREKNKHMVMMLVRECKQLATRVVEESGRVDGLTGRLDAETRGAARLGEELASLGAELASERSRASGLEASMEKQLSEFDTEREQLRARLAREEAESRALRERLGGGGAADASPTTTAPVVVATTTTSSSKPKASASVAVGTEPPPSLRTTACQTDTPLETEAPPSTTTTRKTPLSVPVKPSPSNAYAGLSLPKTPRSALAHANTVATASENGGGEGGGASHGVSPRVQAARYKFQEQQQEQNGGSAAGSAATPPAARDLSPTNRDILAAKQQARHTVTQVLSRFTSPPLPTT